MKKRTLLLIAFLMLAFAGRGFAQFSDFEDDTSTENNGGNNNRNTRRAGIFSANRLCTFS